jgi:hypothetical protein
VVLALLALLFALAELLVESLVFGAPVQLPILLEEITGNA